MKYIIYTLGCKVNQYDTEAILEAFERAGYASVRFSPHFQNAGIGNAQGIGFDRQYLRRHG